jgi:formate dehydrogenase iron-sulfur subunit
MMQNEMIDSYLDMQQGMTAVEHFSVQHDFKQFAKEQAQYTQLIPKKTPGPGQQYAFEVDLDKCTGCKACVTACHNENGLEEDETWRSVGLIHGGTSEKPAIQHITSACHHCLEPACSTGCPVKAYEKDAVTGIVKHLEDQCIGCQYCTLTCPYDVPKYSKSKGIVHKCDMCISRLKVGEAPACVRACPSSAIKITTVDMLKVKQNPSEYVDIPDAPDSLCTFPTTKYKTKRKLPWNMVSSDYASIKPEHSHLPLVVMLVLTQLSVGAFGTELILEHYMDINLKNALLPLYACIALGVGLLALGASLFHLGRPLYAFRAVLGLKTSWLSREILAFGLFAFLATVYALSFLFHPIGEILNILLGKTFSSNVLGILVVASGALGIMCSVKVYKVTQRPLWNSDLTTLKFFMTAGILGISILLLTSTTFAVASPSITLVYVMQSFGNILCLTLGLMMLMKLALEATIFVHLGANELTFFKKTALLMTGPLKTVTRSRFACGLIGGIVLPFLLLNVNEGISSAEMILIAVLVFFASLAGELLERYLFFKAVVPLSL